MGTNKKSIYLSFELLSSFGFCSENLRSNNTVTPIAYFLMKREKNKDIVTSIEEEENRNKIKFWIIIYRN